jgi:hypothetical protein
MSTADLKSLLHDQIDRLQQEDDLQDLLLTVSEFVSHRGGLPDESPELLAQLQHALSSASAGNFTPHSDVVQEAKQWITK